MFRELSLWSFNKYLWHCWSKMFSATGNYLMLMHHLSFQPDLLKAFCPMICENSSIHHVLTFMFVFTDDCKITLLESLSVGPKPMVALSLTGLPGDLGHVILAMGGLDNKIHIYSGDKTGKVCEMHSVSSPFPFLCFLSI